jgi:phosphoribosylaminoimidazolecarboxamide formyltransferase/IMP cyclohydrolase
MADPGLTQIKRALVSVSDKTGVVALARFLAERGVEILSTGGSAEALRKANVPVTDVAQATGQKEILDGRVKTLHPKIHGGILARRDDPSHLAQLSEQGIAPIDLVVVNLYPFETTLAAGGDIEACLEKIDIGGPAMIRAAAKNHDFVTVVVNPADYPLVTAEMTENDGATTAALRRRLAGLAFSRVAAYDAAISNWLAQIQGELFPHRLVMAGTRQQMLRYGENPHQQAAFYASSEQRFGVATAIQIQGKELSYNNLNDTDAAFECVAEFAEPACVIVKHANPCGVAVAPTLAEAWTRALACDPVSAFGGVAAFNRPLDAATATEVAKLFTEVVIAPEVENGARAILAEKKNLRVLEAGGLPVPSQTGLVLRSLAGGFLVQTRDTGRTNARDLKVVSKRAPDARETEDLLFAFIVAKHVKSNAVVFAKNQATVAIGAGQMSRVDAARMAVLKALDAAGKAGETRGRTEGSVVASDAFFPFADGLIVAADAGATAAIAPGGSLRDDEVIAAADIRGMAFVHAPLRHFRH